MVRALLLVGLAGLSVLIAVLALYGVIGAQPTPPGKMIVLPNDLRDVVRPHKAGGPIYILLVGTSLTARGDWPKKLERELASCARLDVVVERLAKSGKGIRWGLSALETRMSDTALPHPDITIVEFAGNDSALRQGLPLFLARKRTLHLIEILRQSGSVVFLSTMNPGWGSEALPRPGQARYHGMYRDLVAETGVGLIDTVPQWLELSAEVRKRVVPDGGHPNDEGASLITIPAFLEALKPLVCGPT